MSLKSKPISRRETSKFTPTRAIQVLILDPQFLWKIFLEISEDFIFPYDFFIIHPNRPTLTPILIQPIAIFRQLANTHLISNSLHLTCSLKFIYVQLNLSAIYLNLISTHFISTHLLHPFQSILYPAISNFWQLNSNIFILAQLISI